MGQGSGTVGQQSSSTTCGVGSTTLESILASQMEVDCVAPTNYTAANSTLCAHLGGIDTKLGEFASGLAITDDRIPRGNATNDNIENGTWSNVGNDIYPETTGSNIGDATHRIGTIFMASKFDYASELQWESSSTIHMRLGASGNLAVGGGVSGSARIRSVGDASIRPFIGIAATGLTNSREEGLVVRHSTTATPVDGFGVLIAFELEHPGSGTEQCLGDVGFARDGADDTGKFIVRGCEAGTAFEILTGEATGELFAPSLSIAEIDALGANSKGLVTKEWVLANTTWAAVLANDNRSSGSDAIMSKLSDATSVATQAGSDGIKFRASLWDTGAGPPAETTKDFSVEHIASTMTSLASSLNFTYDASTLFQFHNDGNLEINDTTKIYAGTDGGSIEFGGNNSGGYSSYVYLFSDDGNFNKPTLYADTFEIAMITDNYSSHYINVADYGSKNINIVTPIGDLTFNESANRVRISSRQTDSIFEVNGFQTMDWFTYDAVLDVATRALRFVNTANGVTSSGVSNTAKSAMYINAGTSSTSASDLFNLVVLGGNGIVADKSRATFAEELRFTSSINNDIISDVSSDALIQFDGSNGIIMTTDNGGINAGSIEIYDFLVSIGNWGINGGANQVWFVAGDGFETYAPDSNARNGMEFGLTDSSSTIRLSYLSVINDTYVSYSPNTDSYPSFINAKDASANVGIVNSVILAGEDVNADKSGYAFTNNIEIQRTVAGSGVLMLGRMTTTEKNGISAVNGMLVYDSTLEKFQGYENGAWTSLI